MPASVSTVSFGNTKQAKDDLFQGGAEDSGIVLLDVLRNDLGGNAKSLYAVDNGTSTGGDRPVDLLVQDAALAEEVSALGARIWITADGKVAYDTASPALQFIGNGQSVSDSFTYAIRLGNGTLSWASVTVTVTGTNDVPVIGGVSTASVTEDASTPNLSASGALTIADVDQNQSSFVAQSGTAGSNGYGSFTVDAAGNWTYAADNSQAAIQQLGVGQSLTDSFTVVSQDGSASRVVTVTI
ncbi:MAG TPA: VCBS domain-containing protein, partial [Noviherbaspirillum sp.]|uniref:VCBS domain-containing protein n=1 Tax=Noviherbaspirillum sp. TaxID=1926288 RepID=UPI002D5B6202